MNLMKKKIFALCGSTRANSANLQLLKAIATLSANEFEIEIYDQLAALPHFNPDRDNETPPELVTTLREKIKACDGVLICTPEYVFSLPGSLKNAIEWTVSTTLFSHKPTAIITASGLGDQAHASLQLIMKTLEANMTEHTQLHIAGVRNKVNADGEIMDKSTLKKINELIKSLSGLIKEK
ncbi:MAG: hypothetical protein DI538_03705 [Azospira oryzae]|jgi:chromate reductase|nr:MAG: hypothetical protein DI538_03705 [Azospira oryzae]